jgi:uncharacterized protein YbjT (DUF2867 family)
MLGPRIQKRSEVNMFVLAGVTGNTGRVVADTLLAQQVPVRVIVRDAEKGEAWRARGADVAIADVHDAAAMTRALDGAVGAYLLNPPNMAVSDIVANGRAVARALLAAIDASSVQHVVMLSSIAAQLASGTGPIVSAHVAEQELRKSKKHITFLRAGYFMENLLANLHPMRTDGVLPAMFDPAHPIDMVATADIGAVAAELLRAGKNAPRVVELAGPQPSTLHEAARAFGAALNKTLHVPVVPAAAQVDILKGVGLNDAWARAYAELNQAVTTIVAFENAPRRGVISLQRFVDLQSL